ncbi:MAG: DUF1566 domain-containing protein [Candidatus Aureabacteria bacterium]|nr:DUF1566 domain-containing protein [Candidatus Auribacterota bacterium]
MKRWMMLVSAVMFSVGAAGAAVAGSMDFNGAPSGGSGMYSLSQVYDYLNWGTVAPTPGPFREPGVGPGSTMKTLKEIYDDIKAKLDECGATAADVKAGKTFFSTLSGSWGVQTGMWATPTPTNTPTPIPTITPTPTPTPCTGTWYECYGPSGTGDVVLISSMYVASKMDGVGCFGGGTKTWAGGLSWADALVWMGKDDWRIPSISELESICSGKASLGSWQTGDYWSSTVFATAHCVGAPCAWDVYFQPACYTYDHHKQSYSYPVRVVRP